MGQAVLIPIEEYLASHYDPDRDYVDGALVERNVGEKDHSKQQARLTAFFFARRKTGNLNVFPEQRIQVSPKRFRVPDVCVTLGPEPDEQVFTRPPFLCIEILSPSDTMHSMQERIDDYLSFGVPFVWVIDPQNRRGWVYTLDGAREARDGFMRTANPELFVPLAEMFDND